MSITLMTVDHHYLAILIGDLKRDYLTRAFELDIEGEVSFETRRIVFTKQMNIGVMVCAFLESTINALLSRKLDKRALAYFDKSNLLDKWFLIPQILNAETSLNNSSHLFGQLKALCKYRNAVVHNKTNIQIGANTHKGQRPDLLKHDLMLSYIDLPILLTEELSKNFQELESDLSEFKKYIND